MHDTRRPSPGRLAGPLLAAVLAAAAAGCRSAPPAAASAGRFTVRAASEELAREVAAETRRAAGWIEAHLPGTVPPRRGEVWIVEDVAPAPWLRISPLTNGLTARLPWVTRTYLEEASWRKALAHELVHALLGRGWEGIPAFLEEGLCDWVAVASPVARDPQRRLELRVVAVAALGGRLRVQWSPAGLGPGSRASVDFTFRSSLPPLEAVAGSTSEGLVRAAYGRRATAFGLGYVLAERWIEGPGLAALYAASRRALAEGRGPLRFEELLAGVGVASLEQLSVELLADLDEAELAALAESLGPAVLRSLPEPALAGDDVEVRLVVPASGRSAPIPLPPADERAAPPPRSAGP